MMMSFFITLATYTSISLLSVYDSSPLTWLDESMIVSLLVLLLEEGVPVEPDHLVGNTTTAEPVAHAFRYEQYDLWIGNQHCPCKPA